MRSLGLVHLIPPLFSIHLALAVSIPFRGYLSDSTHLSKRNNLTGISVTNGGNIIYGASINLGGNNFSVVLDTGRHVHPHIFHFLFAHLVSAPTSGSPVVFPALKTREKESQ
jgi:hypothetical protein